MSRSKNRGGIQVSRGKKDKEKGRERRRERGLTFREEILAEQRCLQRLLPSVAMWTAR